MQAGTAQKISNAILSGAAGFASSFSPNHSGWGGLPMPSTIAADEEVRGLVSILKEKRRGVFAIASGSRATPEYLESIVAHTGRPAFMATVIAMYSAAQPRRALEYYERCAAALERGHEVYIHANCQPLSFDFTLAEPYPLQGHAAFDAVKAAQGEARAAVYRDPAFRRRFREDLEHPRSGVLFQGGWSDIELDGVPVTELARQAGKDALDYVFDLPLDVGLIAKLYQNDDAGVAPLLRHRAGVVALSDAGAHLIYLCDAGFGLHFLAHWVRETGAFTLEEGVRRLSADPARKYRIPGRGAIAPGAWADLVLFDPGRVGVSALERVRDLPAGGARMLRRPQGVHGVWVNGQRVFDGERHDPLAAGPGRVLRTFDS